MRLELTGRHVDITPGLRRLVDTKLARLERMLNDSAVSAEAVLTREKHRHRTEITLHARGEKLLHGVADSASWEQSVALAIDKIVQQAQRMKGSGRRASGRASGARRRRPEAAAPAPAPKAARVRPKMPRILRPTRQTIKPMSVEDAAREAEASRDGLVIFRDVVTSAVSVVYRRANGEIDAGRNGELGPRRSTTDYRLPTIDSMPSPPGVSVDALLRSRPEAFGLPLRAPLGRAPACGVSSPARTSRRPVSRWPASTST